MSRPLSSSPRAVPGSFWLRDPGSQGSVCLSQEACLLRPGSV